MATKNDIITLPHTSLRQRSRRVGFISDEIRGLVEDMQNSLLDWEASRDHEAGVALAAVQINQLYRVIVIRSNFNDKEDHSFGVFINPRITKYEGEILEDYEGCLSIKDIYGKVPRSSKVRVKAVGLDGKEIRLTAEGFLARTFQHEIDHTNGIVFIDHIKDSKEAFYHLDPDGHLKVVDYDKDIKENPILWQ